MTFTELRYIIALAQEKHFGRAAQACNVSQPTLSISIKKIEEALGSALFERFNNDIKLTEFGERIVEQAKKIILEVTILKDMACHHKDQLKETLRIGAIYTIGPYLFPLLIPELIKIAPQMPVAIQEDFTENFRLKIKQGEVDVVILALPFQEPGIVTMPLYKEPFVALIPAQHEWNSRKAINPHDLAEQKLLLLGEGHCFRDQVLSACDNCQNTMQEQDYIGSSLETIRYMVASGLGVTVLPITASNAKQNEKKLLSYKPFIGVPPQRQVVLAWRKTFPRPKVIDAVRQAILACKLQGVDYLT